MLAERSFHAIFTPDFLFIGLLFDSPLLLPLALCLWLSSTCTWAWQWIYKITSAGQSQEERECNPFVYKCVVTSPVAPSNCSSWLTGLVWLFQSAEITAAKITSQTSCSGPVFGPPLRSKPLNHSKIVLSLKPHIPWYVQSILLYLPSPLNPSTALLWKFEITAIFFPLSQLPRFVRDSLKQNIPFPGSRGVAVVSVAHPCLCTSVHHARISCEGRKSSCVT